MLAGIDILEHQPDRKGYCVIRWQGDSEGFNTYVSKESDGWDFSSTKGSCIFFRHRKGAQRLLSSSQKIP